MCSAKKFFAIIFNEIKCHVNTSRSGGGDASSACPLCVRAWVWQAWLALWKNTGKLGRWIRPKQKHRWAENKFLAVCHLAFHKGWFGPQIGGSLALLVFRTHNSSILTFFLTFVMDGNKGLNKKVLPPNLTVNSPCSLLVFSHMSTVNAQDFYRRRKASDLGWCSIFSTIPRSIFSKCLRTIALISKDTNSPLARVC